MTTYPSMARLFTLALLAVTIAFLSSSWTTSPASAESIGAWGVWGHWNDERGNRHRRGERSNYLPDNNIGYDNTPNKGRVFPPLMSGGARPFIEPTAPDIVRFSSTEEPGTIIIDTDARTLYYTLNAQKAYAYPISVGRTGYTWTGSETVSRLQQWPDWHPPQEMLEREPGLPKKMTGGVKNPLGAVAIYLGDTLYRIHGTNDAKTIGRAASSGCFRMLNKHAVHLASLANVGTTVKIVQSVQDLDTVLHTPQSQKPKRQAHKSEY